MNWEKLFHDAVRDRCSDIHIAPRQAGYAVLVRIDGVLSVVHEGSRDEYSALCSSIKHMAKLDLAERGCPQDASFAMDHGGRAVNLHVVTVPTIDSEQLIIRITDPAAAHLSLGQHGITELETWRKAVNHPNGLCLVCGPAGAGKTTTMLATARERDNASGVLILGEIRDIETVRNALEAAKAGQLVLGTFHTTSIRNAVARLHNIGVDPHELRQLLRGVLIQRLMRVTCHACSGDGCSACNETGYRGREVVSEVVNFENEAEVDAVLEGKVFWRTIFQDAKRKVLEGRTTEQELMCLLGVDLSQIPD
jgi:general secretion pathway protein E